MKPEAKNHGRRVQLMNAEEAKKLTYNLNGIELKGVIPTITESSSAPLGGMLALGGAFLCERKISYPKKHAWRM